MRGRESLRGAIANDSGGAWNDRCVVVCPRHDFIRSWIRAYFSCGNDIPLVIATGPEGDWDQDDREYCEAAARFSGGMILDCSSEWEASKALAKRAVREDNIGWFAKRLLLLAVATKLGPRSWAWIDDDAEVAGNLSECFEYAEKAPGFICSQFYYPGEIDNRHPAMMYRSNIDTGDKICWNSMTFFHGEANKRLAESLNRDFPVEDDEVIFGQLYNEDEKWHEGFCDFSPMAWQTIVKVAAHIPERIDEFKVVHYTAGHRGKEVKKLWADKASLLPAAAFEGDVVKTRKEAFDDGSVDAVFVIGTGSQNGNEELRYALRNIESHCKFIRDVYICGECPSWVDKSKVKHLRWPDRFSHAKDANIIDKLRHACEHPGIAKKILFCSDDQFNTRPCSWDDFRPRYLRVFDKGDRWYDGKRRVWHSRLKKTLDREVDRRAKIGLDTKSVFYFQPHMWMQIDRDKFLEYAKWCGYDNRSDTIIASGYFNFAGEKGEPDFDHVFLSAGDKAIPEATHVAYHDGSYGAAMLILRRLFPRQSRFEVASREVSRANPKKPASNCEKPALLSGDDPSPAKSDEMAELNMVMSKARSNPIWNSLLGEISRAEEMRLFGARGWRTVWRDIVSRWSADTRRGADEVKVTSPRSDEAARILGRYMSDPDSLRTRRYGPSAQVPVHLVSDNASKIPASSEAKASLHEKIRAMAMRK